jgi:signal transduction histidine kinase
LRLPRLLRSAFERHRRDEALRRRPIRVLYLVDNAAAAANDIGQLAAVAPYLYCEVLATAAITAQRVAEVARSGSFDVVVLETQGGDASSVLEIVKELRETPGSDPATVILAGARDEDFALAAMRLGVSDYQFKTPGYLELLPAVIEQAHARAELARLNADLERRVSERTSELNAVIRQLEAFAHTVAHDLQAPARAVGGFARVLAEELGAAATPETVRILQRIERNAVIMHELIDGVLEVARAANAPLERELTDLTALVNECIELIEAQPRPTFAVAALGYARVDPGSFRQVFSNLLGNAAKFARASSAPRIEIGRQDREGASIWFVRDNGVGFDMSQAGELFRMFRRLHRRDEFEGSGVGLANVARIIERHGGRIWAEAEPGKGATFYFTIGR